MDLKPIIDILERCEDSLSLSDKEKFWINKLLSDGHQLLNILTYDDTIVDKQRELNRLKRQLDDSINDIKSKFKNSLSIDNLPNIVKNRRKQAGLTQIKLSEISGVGKTVIWDIEHGKDTVKLRTLLKVLHTLSIKIALVHAEDVK
jgi:HTH-type transcriptional regulator/antitoxin HipB